MSISEHPGKGKKAVRRGAPHGKRNKGGPFVANVPGLPARLAAVAHVHAVLAEGRAPDFGEIGDALPPRDRALARAIAGASLRRLGTLRAVLARRLAKGMPQRAGTLEAVLVTGAAQIFFLDVPVHAAVDLAVHAARADRHAMHFASLVNAVLRGVSADGMPPELEADSAIDTPSWLYQRWISAYGLDRAAGIARMHRVAAPLDLTAKGDAAALATATGGVLLPTGSVRVTAHGPITELPGFEDGTWWVQDAAAALPALLLDVQPGERVLDMCAAPGGKTAQLAAAGASVTALDRSEARLEILAANLDRLGLSAKIVAGDGRTFEAEPFDAVLLDAPCTATGTIRRHPDVAWLKQARDIGSLVTLQGELLEAAARLVRPGGRLVYSVCSLDEEEGEAQVTRFLAAHPEFAPERAENLAGAADLLDDSGFVRALPTHWPDEDPRRAGLDGFFAARLRRL